MVTNVRCPDAERLDGNTQPSCLASHLFRRISKTRPLIGTSRRPSAVLLSGTKITWFCQSRFSIRIRKSSLSFLIPVSRIKMTMSRKRSHVRGRQLQTKAPIVSFLSASSSRRRCRPCFFIILIFGTWLITFIPPLCEAFVAMFRKAQLAFAAEPGNLNCSAQSPVIWSTRRSHSQINQTASRKFSGPRPRQINYPVGQRDQRPQWGHRTGHREGDSGWGTRSP
jgi:hypothetical protein